ncbi:MAG: hypothetical protein Q4C04_01255 [Clostridia bacterium]|nr:hypothetical protein [Clostridia bacterium]
MKNYEKPTMAILKLNPMDIIAASGEQGQWNASVRDGVADSDNGDANSIWGDYNVFTQP